MSQRANGAGAFQSALSNIEREFQRLQKEVQHRGRALEKRLSKGRKSLEARGRKLEAQGRKRVKNLVSELRKNSAVKRAAALRKDAARQVEEAITAVLGALQIASRSELDRIERRVRAVDRKLQALEKERAPRASRSAERPAASL